MGTTTQDSEPVPRVVRARSAARSAAATAADDGDRRSARSKAGSGRVGRDRSGAGRAERRAGRKAGQDTAKRAGRKAEQNAQERAGSEPGDTSSALLVAPELRGPRVRVGILWFLIAMAAATAGRWWTAGLWALVAAVAGRELVVVWTRQGPNPAGEGSERPLPRGLVLLAATGAAAVPLAAGYGTGTAGLVLLVVSVGSASVALAAGGPRSRAMCLPLAIVLPAIPATAAVLAVRVDLWVGLFLVLAVSLYDAGAFVMGADAAGRWEGPVSGAVGVLAATFTMASFGVPPFDTASAWVTGVLVAACCPLGTALVSAALPAPDDHVRALRRLDSYLVAAPVLVGAAWLVG